ncbi:MAG: response regulator, partial [Phenylobacterium sp.]|nr:response regulator [Phenylobacterium sp.]
DDVESVRATPADMLADLGFEVTEAASGGAALQLLRSGLAPDLLVTDHLMPGMTGTELARTVQSDRPETRILIISGYAEAVGVDADLARLNKPFRRDELEASVSDLLR